MPEIWEDNLEYDDFSESFYEHVHSILSGQTPRVVRSILESLEIDVDSDSDDVARIFLNYFECDDGEWSNEHWH